MRKHCCDPVVLCFGFVILGQQELKEYLLQTKKPLIFRIIFIFLSNSTQDVPQLPICEGRVFGPCSSLSRAAVATTEYSPRLVVKLLI